MIYWLTGQPGAGKTTSGTSIMDLYPTKSVHIDGDDMRNCFQDKDIFQEAFRRGGHNLWMETDGLIKDSHMGETGHLKLSEIIYEEISSSNYEYQKKSRTII